MPRYPLQQFAGLEGVSKVVTHPEEVGQGQEKTEDDQPFEAATVASSYAAQVEINREHQPGGQGHPDLGIARL